MRFSLRNELDRQDAILFACIAILVFVTRRIFAGPVYFVDGPLLIATIRLKWFIIQSPGYWLYAHLGGFFHDPAKGLAFWNQLFSSLGSAVFFLLARLLGTEKRLALLAALTYSFTYYIWFCGEIHSSYAAEILFPALTLCCFLKLEQRRTIAWSGAAAISSGLAIALRPSDGIFLLPLWAYLLWRDRSTLRIVAVFCVTSVVAFLAWYLPTQHAVHRIGFNSTESQLMICLRATSVFLVGITPHSLANVSRVYVPLLLAYWPVLPLLFSRRSRKANWVLAFWTLPGLLFFTFGYMADPTYVVFLSGAFVLAALLQESRRSAVFCLSLCLLWNVGVFTTAQPRESTSPQSLLWNFYLTKYCAYGIRHQWTATPGQLLPVGRGQ